MRQHSVAINGGTDPASVVMSLQEEMMTLWGNSGTASGNLGYALGQAPNVTAAAVIAAWDELADDALVSAAVGTDCATGKAAPEPRALT